MTSPQTLSGDIQLDLPEFDIPPSAPLPIVREWMDRAQAVGVRELAAATLATAGQEGPSTRTVLIKDVDDTRLVFTTSAASRKGCELETDPRCALTFYWRETMQQISVKGRAVKATVEESDARFDARPAAARAAVIASHQSRPLQDEDTLRERAKIIEESGELQRPDEWHAWHVIPDEVEFWHGSANRLHRRLCYRRGANGAWDACRLEP
ncbi:pyridoxal 5'-phosphate synthase [Kocuria sp.]|uniref:pyridoxal 5'-phosphate synthase n=1 Tax=Kocuria sp. TaxID=1871328 RepID=UPI0026E0444E|nr:pyridoxal 5'-phosphate synthase [Kocuria sp.]MDO5618527.1 pyridoxal 5'-phosphate synthase [Kocuria sp.]